MPPSDWFNRHPMDAEALYRFPARMESLASMHALLKAVSFGAEVPAVLRAETALEELLTNTVSYGARGLPDSDSGSVWMSASLQGERLEVRFEDAFAPFDPLPKIEEALQRTTNPMDQRPLGGLGLLMVYRLSDEFRYRCEGGRNRVHMVFRERDLLLPPAT